MAQTSEHSAEDLVPIQTFMRRFSHVEPGQEESTRQSRDEGEAQLAAAALQKQSTQFQLLLENFRGAFRRASPPRPPRQPGRLDFIVLPLINAKNWCTDHPKATMTILAFLLSTLVDKMPYYKHFHKLVCWCIEDEACVLAFILRHMKFMVLCL